MDEFKVIAVMNEAMLKLLKDKKANYDINLKIKEVLKDEAIFFKIKKESACNILQNVGIKAEQIENVYEKLISPMIFYDLLHRGKINAEDKNLIIKYKIYSNDDLFKKK